MTAVDFYFDIASPYSYLAATQIESVAQKHGASVRWCPFLLGAVFKATDNSMPAAVPAKAKYMLADLYRWAETYGVDFAFPALFPVGSVKPLRACIAAGDRDQAGPFALAIFRQYWCLGRDPSSPEALTAAATEVGLPADEILAAIETQPIKDRLRENTERAIALGAFGAPSMVVGDVLLWGNDRLDMLEWVLEKKKA